MKRLVVAALCVLSACKAKPADANAVTALVSALLTQRVETERLSVEVADVEALSEGERAAFLRFVDNSEDAALRQNVIEVMTTTCRRRAALLESIATSSRRFAELSAQHVAVCRIDGAVRAGCEPESGPFTSLEASMQALERSGAELNKRPKDACAADFPERLDGLVKSVQKRRRR
ncbi:MAG: hypothetical protein ACO1OB_27430 [Archangium sp.]